MLCVALSVVMLVWSANVSGSLPDLRAECPASELCHMGTVGTRAFQPADFTLNASQMTKARGAWQPALLGAATSGSQFLEPRLSPRRAAGWIGTQELPAEDGWEFVFSMPFSSEDHFAHPAAPEQRGVACCRVIVAPTLPTAPPVFRTPANDLAPPICSTPALPTAPPVFGMPANDSAPPICSTPTLLAAPPVFRAPANDSAPPICSTPTLLAAPPVFRKILQNDSARCGAVILSPVLMHWVIVD